MNKTEFLTKIFPTYCKNNYTDTVYNNIDTIYVFGDIHGDYDLAITMFKLSNTITIENDIIKWIGGKSFIIQVGDQIDNCRPSKNTNCNTKIDKNDTSDDLKILQLFTYINELAEPYGGKVISLLGNHEILNSEGNLMYVSNKNLSSLNSDINKAYELRKDLFKPGNEYGKLLGCTRQACVIVNSHLFVHAGIIDTLLKQLQLNSLDDIENINIKIRLWLLGLFPKDTLTDILDNQQISMFWLRELGNLQSNINKNDPKCNLINNTISILNINDIIIGHTPQSFIHNKNINSTCSGRVWRVDNGSASAFDVLDHELLKTGKKHINRHPQILKIVNNKYYLIYYNNQIIETPILYDY